MVASLADLDRLAFANAIRDRLADQVDGMVVHTDDQPGNIYLGEPVGEVAKDRDGYAAKYFIVWPTAGSPSLERDLARAGIDLDWTVQVTIAAGWVEDVLDGITEVHAALYGWEPVVAGVVFGPMEPPEGFDPGSVRPDRDVSPPRPFIALQYSTRITAT